MLTTLDKPQPTSSFTLSLSDLHTLELEDSIDLLALDPDSDIPDPGFVLQARRLADRHPTATALARLAKAEFDAGNRVSSLEAARAVIQAPEAHCDAGALVVAADVAMVCGDAGLAGDIVATASTPTARQAVATRAAMLAARHGDLDLALSLLDASTADTDPTTWELRGLLQLKRSQFGAAISSLRRSIRAEVATPDAYINLSYAYASVGSMAKALRAATTAYALAPTSRVAGINLASLYDGEGEHTRALKIVDELLEIYPRDPHLHFGRAELVARTAGVNRALDDLRKIRTQGWFRDASERAHAELDSLIATMRVAKGETSRAAAFRSVLAAAARSDYRSEQIARQLGDIAGGFSEADDLEIAIELFDGKVELADLYPARVSLAWIRRDVPTALTLLDEWARCDPSSPSVWITGSNLQLHNFDFVAAAGWAQDGLLRFPTHPILLNNLAFAYALAGYPAEARRVEQPDAYSIMSRATAAAIDMSGGDIERGRDQYATIAASIRQASPDLAQVVLLYRAFSTLVFTGELANDDDLTLPHELRDEASLNQLLDTIHSVTRSPEFPGDGGAHPQIVIEPRQFSPLPARTNTPQQGAPMTKGNNRHVTPRPDGRWQVIKPGATRASVVTDTQRDAVSRARDIVHNAGGGEVRIQGRDGRIRDSDTIRPGRDPHPPIDKK